MTIDAIPVPPDNGPVSFLHGIGGRLALAFGALVLVMCAVSGLLVYKMDELAGLTEKLYRHPFNVTNSSRSVETEFIRLHLELRDLATNTSHAVAPEMLDKGAKTLQEIDGRIKADMVIVKERFLGPKAMVEEIDKRLGLWRAFSGKVVALKNDDKDREAVELVATEGELLRKDSIKAIQALRDWAIAKAKAFNEGAIAARNEAFAEAAGAILLALILGVGAAFFVTRSITRPLRDALVAVERFASGDLSHDIEVRGRDETARLLASMRGMQDKLREVASGIGGGADALAASAAEFSASARQVSASSEEQSQAAVSTSAAVEQLTVSISHVSDNARNAESVSRDANHLADQGATVIQKAVDEIGRIAEAVNQSSESIANLEKQSENIFGITGVIRDIADQTNLLALNAAIEAARAGEQGRGFAVVADEVRKLAERTATSTGEISLMLEKMLKDGREAARNMEASVSLVESGRTLAAQAGDAIRGITAGNARVVSEVNDISNAVGEQKSASESIARNVERIAQMIEENSAAARQNAGSAEGLNDVADRLRGQAAWFRT
jgi:methyl-accepting chemotaxis protein